MCDLFGIVTVIGMLIGLIFIVAPMEYFRIKKEKEQEEKNKKPY